MSVLDALAYFLKSAAVSWGAIVATTSSDTFDTTSGGVGLSRVMRVKFNYTAAQLATSTGSIVFWIDKSTDDSTYYPFVSGEDQAITLSTTAQSGEAVLKFSSVDRYFRARVLFVGSPGTPTITINSVTLSVDSY